MPDDLGFEDDPKPEQKAASRFSLSWIDQEKLLDAAKKNKLKTGAGLTFVVLFMVWLIFSSPAPPAAKPTVEDPRAMPVSPDQMKAYSAELQKKIREQIDQLNALRARQAGTGTVSDEEEGNHNTNSTDAQKQYGGAIGDSQGERSGYVRSASYSSSNEAQRIEAALHSGNLVQQETTSAAFHSENALEQAGHDGEPEAPSQSGKAILPRQEAKKPDPNGYAASTGKLYRLPEETVIEAALVNKLNNAFSGPVIAQVTTDIWTHDGQRLLVPAGTKVNGEVKKVEGLGQQRLALTFHRMLMPDLFPVNLDQFQGLNQIGETGLLDKVNHHYLQVFGTSIALGAIAGLSQIGTNYGGYGGISPMDQYRAGVTESLSESAARILDRYTNILPTFTVREGTRIRIILSQDLLLPAYGNHRLPADL